MDGGESSVGRQFGCGFVEFASAQRPRTRYLSVGSMLALMRELNERVIVTRKRRLSSGKLIGGIPFTKGPLAYLLKTGCISVGRAIQASIPQLSIGTSLRRFKAASRRRPPQSDTGAPDRRLS
jgi:hypothetical protein